MKLKRLALLALSTISVFGMASCGETPASNTNPTETTTQQTTPNTTSGENTPNTTAGENTTNSEEEQKEHTLQYQWTGVNTEMANFGFAYSYILNLYADGKLDGYGYSMYSLDTSAAEENKSLTKWYDGVWAIATDDDDNECIKAVVNFADGVKGQTGQPITGKNTYLINFDSDGETPLNISGFTIPIGISGRSVTLEYNADPYETLDEFIQDTSYKFVEPEEYAAVFEDTKTKERLYLFADNTGFDYGARLGENDTLIGYYPKGEISWSYKEEKLTVVIGGTPHEAVIAENKSATIAWEEAVYGDYVAKYNFYCEDVSNLIGQESGGEEEGPSYSQGTLYFDYVALASSQVKARFVCSASDWLNANALNYKPVEGDTGVLFSFAQEVGHGEKASCHFDCLKDGTYKFSFTSYSLTETGTWSFNNYSFKYVDAKGGEHSATMVA